MRRILHIHELDSIDDLVWVDWRLAAALTALSRSIALRDLQMRHPACALLEVVSCRLLLRTEDRRGLAELRVPGEGPRRAVDRVDRASLLGEGCDAEAVRKLSRLLRALLLGLAHLPQACEFVVNWSVVACTKSSASRLEIAGAFVCHADSHSIVESRLGMASRVLALLVRWSLVLVNAVLPVDSLLHRLCIYPLGVLLGASALEPTIASPAGHGRIGSTEASLGCQYQLRAGWLYRLSLVRPIHFPVELLRQSDQVSGLFGQVRTIALSRCCNRLKIQLLCLRVDEQRLCCALLVPEFLPRRVHGLLQVRDRQLVALLDSCQGLSI